MRVFPGEPCKKRPSLPYSISHFTTLKNNHTEHDLQFFLQQQLRPPHSPSQHGRFTAFPRCGQTSRRSQFRSGDARRERAPRFSGLRRRVGEVLAPLALILGLFTRGAAAVVAFNMLVAIAMTQLGSLCSVDPNTGGWAVELPMLYLLPALALVFTGGGRFAVSTKTWLD